MTYVLKISCIVAMMSRAASLFPQKALKQKESFLVCSSAHFHLNFACFYSGLELGGFIICQEDYVSYLPVEPIGLLKTTNPDIASQ